MAIPLPFPNLRCVDLASDSYVGYVNESGDVRLHDKGVEFKWLKLASREDDENVRAMDVARQNQDEGNDEENSEGDDDDEDDEGDEVNSEHK